MGTIRTQNHFQNRRRDLSGPAGHREGPLQALRHRHDPDVPSAVQRHQRRLLLPPRDLRGRRIDLGPGTELIPRRIGTSMQPFILRQCTFEPSCSSQVLGTGIAVLVVERFGRRPLLLISDLVMSLSILALGVYFYMQDHVKCEEGVMYTMRAIFASCKPITSCSHSTTPLPSLPPTT